MHLHRLAPTPHLQATKRSAGRCAACEKSLKDTDSVVHLYGEAFHYDCAFYRHTANGRRPPAA